MQKIPHKSNRELHKSSHNFQKGARLLLTKTQKSFTLVEMLMATGILLLALGAILMAVVSCIVLNENNNSNVIAANDATYVLEQIKGLDYTNIAGYAAPVLTNLSGETITLTRNIGSSIAEVTVNVNWSERGRSKNFQLATRIAK